MYKIMAKVLAIGMNQVLGALISNGQNAFIGERQILDLVLVDNECMDSRLRLRIPGVTCKLDLKRILTMSIESSSPTS